MPPGAPRQPPGERCTCLCPDGPRSSGTGSYATRPPRRTKKANVGKSRGEPKQPSAASKKKKKEPSAAQTFSSWIPQKGLNKKSAGSAVFQLPAEPTPRFPADPRAAAACGLPPVPRPERRLTALRGAQQPARTRRASARAAPQ